MAAPNRAYLEALLVGTPLPASKRELLAYARRQGAPPEALAELRRLPDAEFAALQDVGEALAPAQPARDGSPGLPKPESGLPPGGEAYTRPPSPALGRSGS